MAIETPAHSGAKPSHRLSLLSLTSWLRRLRPLRSLWGYALAALALLAVSQALWLWHSWPVRELLDRDQFVVGLSGLAV